MLTIHSLRDAFTAGLPHLPGAELNLQNALLQTLNHPGSMVRAQMVYEIGIRYGLERSQAENLAISIEYFHTASLIFDDLPCMDDAEKRRGEPCLHRSHGEAAAILAALGLINRAYALAWLAFQTGTLEFRQPAGDYLEECLGVAGVLSGQSLDLHYGNLSGSSRVPHQVALGKTVPLIRLSLVLPAILGGATKSDRLQLERLAKFWGLSYQLIDDLKDLFLKPEITGKTSGQDKLLDRPNDALKAGAQPVLERLERLLRLGDLALLRLSEGKPTFAFLTQLRSRFEEELSSFRLG